MFARKRQSQLAMTEPDYSARHRASASNYQPGDSIVDSTVWVFLAEALILPTGIITAGFLTRRLGPADYGLFTLAATLIVWIEWSITAIFTRAAIKFVSEADDWRPIGNTVVRVHLSTGIAAMVALWLLAAPLARWFGEPSLAGWLQLFSLDIPLFSLAHAQRTILIGLGAFRPRALASAGRWLVRMVLIIALVECGLSVRGAIIGNIGASVAELLISRVYIRPAFFRQSGMSISSLWSYALPLFLSALCMQLSIRADLFALKMLGGTATEVGLYGAAQNLSVVPGIFALSFAPLLLATLSRILRNGDLTTAKQITRNAMRLVILLLPFAGLAAGASSEIVALIFGQAFAGTAPLFAVLIFGGVSLIMISVAHATLTAAGKPRLTLALTGPCLLLSVIGYLGLSLRYQAIGIAIVTTIVAILGALAGIAMLHRLWGIYPPVHSIWRSLSVSGMAYLLAIVIPASGALLMVKLVAIIVLILICFVLLGEIGRSEFAMLRSVIGWQSTARRQAQEA